MNSGDCDCGACCNACGHDADCIIFELNKPRPFDDDGYDRDAHQIA